MAKEGTGAAGAGPEKRPAKKSIGKARGELVLDGNGRVRMRKAGPQAWTRVKEREFLTVLGETCNVKLAAHEAGVSMPYSRPGRRTDNCRHRAKAGACG